MIEENRKFNIACMRTKEAEAMKLLIAPYTLFCFWGAMNMEVYSQPNFIQRFLLKICFGCIYKDNHKNIGSKK